MPMGVMWALTKHPKAGGVDPREYIETREDADNSTVRFIAMFEFYRMFVISGET